MKTVPPMRDWSDTIYNLLARWCPLILAVPLCLVWCLTLCSIQGIVMLVLPTSAEEHDHKFNCIYEFFKFGDDYGSY